MIQYLLWCVAEDELINEVDALLLHDGGHRRARAGPRPKVGTCNDFPEKLIYHESWLPGRVDFIVIGDTCNIISEQVKRSKANMFICHYRLSKRACLVSPDQSPKYQNYFKLCLLSDGNPPKEVDLDYLYILLLNEAEELYRDGK